METTGYMNQVQNAALRGYYRFVCGELPFQEGENSQVNIAVKPEVAKQFLALTTFLLSESGRSLNIDRYAFSPKKNSGASHSNGMSAIFEIGIISSLRHDKLTVEFSLEDPGRIWGVRSVKFLPTYAQQRIYFSNFPSEYDFWE